MKEKNTATIKGKIKTRKNEVQVTEVEETVTFTACM